MRLGIMDVKKAAAVLAGLGLLFLLPGCENESLVEFSGGNGPVFTVSTAGIALTKADTAAGMTEVLGMSSGEDTLYLYVQAESRAATKAGTYAAGILPSDVSIGLMAYKYAASEAAPSAWTLQSNPPVVKADCDVSRADHSWKWVPIFSHRLLWPGEGYVRYFAYAPYEAAGVTVNAVSAAVPTLSYTVPSLSQQADVLVSDAASTRQYAGDPGWRGIDVPLNMVHALTAVRFRIVDGLTISSVSISGVKDSGTLDLTTLVWGGHSGSASYELTGLSLGNGLHADDARPGFNLLDSDKTLLLLPQTLPAGAKITARVTNGDVSRDIEASLESMLWEPGQMVTYTLTNTYEWIYVIDPIDNIYFPGKEAGTQNFTINSYRYKSNDPSYREFVPWEVVGFSQDSTTAFSNPGGSYGFSIETLSKTTGSAIGFNNAASVTEQTQKVVNQMESDIITLQGLRLEYNGVFGTEDQPRDLSMYDIFGNKRTAGKPVTANSYVVDRGGWYMFPVVYGNAIDYTVAENNVAGNVRAYAPVMPADIASGNQSEKAYKNYLTPFLNANKGAINSPYIIPQMGLSESSMSVVILWQDLSQQKLTVSDVQLIPASGIGVTGTDSGLNCAYIKFRVGKDNLFQCNAVLALKNGSGDIVWSWHIWVTGETMSMSEVFLTSDPALEGGAPYKNSDYFLNQNLGWCDAGTATVTEYPSRMLYAKVRQTDPASSAYRIFKIAQSGQSEWINSEYGDSPGYQYGRKDPLLPSAGCIRDEINNKEHYPSVQKTSGTFRERSINTITPRFGGEMIVLANQKTIIKSLINNPQMQLASGTESSLNNRWETYYPYNMWSGQMRLDQRKEDFQVEKTIYDPCPPGFCVPHQYSFTGFYGRDLDAIKMRRCSNRIGSGDTKGQLNQVSNAEHYLKYGSAFYMNSDQDLRYHAIQTRHNFNVPDQTFLTEGSQHFLVSDALSIRPVLEDHLMTSYTTDGRLL
ncbi:MAG: fimbrillin family protein [Bacteroidales bacterium]|nr:fimbrillin family protein [Bacteroidales bacterium]